MKKTSKIHVYMSSDQLHPAYLQTYTAHIYYPSIHTYIYILYRDCFTSKNLKDPGTWLKQWGFCFSRRGVAHADCLVQRLVLRWRRMAWRPVFGADFGAQIKRTLEDLWKTYDIYIYICNGNFWPPKAWIPGINKYIMIYLCVNIYIIYIYKYEYIYID